MFLQCLSVLLPPNRRAPVLRIIGAHLIGSLVVVSASAAPVPQASGGLPPDGVTVVHDVEMGSMGNRPLLAEIAYPAERPAAPLPVVIWIHGGGWSSGTHRKNQAEWLARHGYFTASIEYRLSGESAWPAQIEDCKLAVRWLRANAAAYNIDPERIGVWGSSAGAHLAAFLGTTSGEARFEGRGGHEGAGSSVQAVVCYCAPLDFTSGSEGIQKSLGKAPDFESPALRALFSTSFQQDPERWRDGSPIQHVKPGAPPFLLVHGDQDVTVPHGQSVRFAAALNRAGVPVELITVRGAGHAMTAPKGEPPAFPDGAALKAAVLEFFNRTLKRG